MSIQSNINQALAVGSAGVYGVKKLNEEKMANTLDATRKYNELDEKAEYHQEKLKETQGVLDEAKSNIEGITKEYKDIRGLDVQAQELVDNGIMDVNPLGMNQYWEKRNIALRHLQDRLQSQQQIIDDYTPILDRNMRIAQRDERLAKAYKPYIDRGLK